MTDQAAARRMRLLEDLQREQGGRDLAEYARMFGVDERTIRRDVGCLQDILAAVRGIELRRGAPHAGRDSQAPGYFADQLEHNRAAKEVIARAVVRSLGENQAIVVTAGSTLYYVAREIRRAHVEEERPHNLIAFTNSLPALLELIMAGISTGVIGEVYNPDDRAFHSHEFHTAFQASLAIVGASGVVANAATGVLELFSHRAEEAAFMKQLLGPIPEIIVAADASKLGRRHPWAFTSSAILTAKTVRLYTGRLTEPEQDIWNQLTESARRIGCTFTYHEAE